MDSRKKIPNNEEIEKLGIDARYLNYMFIIADNVPKIIGQKNQLELCILHLCNKINYLDFFVALNSPSC